MICTVKHLKNQHRYYALSAKGKQWKVGEVIDIYFIFEDGDSNKYKREVSNYVKEVASEWEKYGNFKFNWVDDVSKSDIRISFREELGAWSYIGTDALFIPKHEATMNLGWLDSAVVLHEFGHMLGLLHEHQNPKGGLEWNEEVVKRELSGPPNNWDEETIYHNVLRKIPLSSTNGTAFDPRSIMLYFFPGRWTKSGKGTHRNYDLSETDKAYIAQLYPPAPKAKQDTPWWHFLLFLKFWK